MLSLRINKTTALRHVLVWLLFIAYELLLISITAGFAAPIWHYAIHYSLNIGLFYFNAHVILDYAFFKIHRPYLVAIFLILLEILAFLIIKLGVDAFLHGRYSISLAINSGNTRLWLTNIFREIFFIGFSTAYWSMLYLVRFKEKNHAMEKQHLRNVATTLELKNKYVIAENAYLQNQISPHLLFNTLNFIYNSIHNLSNRAGKGVYLLAEIMRYSLRNTTDNRLVTLTGELQQIENLIELSKLRFQDGFYLKITQKGRKKDLQILPLVLVTLVENMIKHGDLSDPQTPGRIKVRVAGKELRFETSNKKRKSTPHPPGGLGLINTEKRLSNFYANRYRFEIEDGNDHFTVALTLHL